MKLEASCTYPEINFNRSSCSPTHSGPRLSPLNTILVENEGKKIDQDVKEKEKGKGKSVAKTNSLEIQIFFLHQASHLLQNPSLAL